MVCQLTFFSTEGIASYIQSAVFDTQMTLEDSCKNVLKARGKPAVILCDRGSMDGTVYLGLKEFSKILAERGTNVVDVRDNRYDAIFHLVTSADGAASYYTLENNAVRTETPEQAIDVDRRTQKAWVGHPHLYVLDNSTDFEGKMNRLVDVICKIVGLPSNLKRRSAKFLLKNLPTSHSELTKLIPDDIHYQLFDVEKVYLQRVISTQRVIPTETPNSSPSSNQDSAADGHTTDADETDKDYSFIRKRSVIDPADGKSILGTTFQLTTVTYAGNEMIEQKRIISQREYLTSFMSRDTSRNIVQQRRISFLYNLQSFVLHIYQQPIHGLDILHAQAEGHAGEVELPPFLQVVRPLLNTPEDEEKYGAYSISRMDRSTMEDLLTSK
mmetsp:Transcript_12551/g.16499  ORF Transcript_12551/g.16499 Transcript_12551/m.16499 type:complete len:384 (+) Transcript_12551:172-1323(+)